MSRKRRTSNSRATTPAVKRRRTDGEPGPMMTLPRDMLSLLPSHGASAFIMRLVCQRFKMIFTPLVRSLYCKRQATMQDIMEWFPQVQSLDTQRRITPFDIDAFLQRDTLQRLHLMRWQTPSMKRTGRYRFETCWGECSLKFLGYLNKLNSLVLYSNMTDYTWMKNLKIKELAFCYTTSAPVNSLPTTLTDLCIIRGATEFTTGFFKLATQLVNLENLTGVLLAHQDQEHLHMYARLRSLRCRIGLRFNVGYLSSLTNLNDMVLHVKRLPQLASPEWHKISKTLTNLEVIWCTPTSGVAEPAVPARVIPALSIPKSIKSLKVSKWRDNKIAPQFFSLLGGCAFLKSLIIKKCLVPDFGFLSQLVKLERLEILNLPECNVSTLAVIQNLKLLTRLVVSVKGWYKPEGGVWETKNLKWFEPLDKIEYLGVIGFVPLTVTRLSNLLRHLPNIKEVDVSGT